MSSKQHVSPGAKRQKAFRERMAGLGMTIPRIYMAEDEQALVRAFLRRYRSARTEQLIEGMDTANPSASWSMASLHAALQVYADTHGELADLEQHAETATIELALVRYGGRMAQLVVANHEILVATALCKRQAVSDVARFNDACLRLGPTLPLSNVGLVGEYYILFGQLSAHAPLANIVEELDVLGRNTVDALNELSDLIR